MIGRISFIKYFALKLVNVERYPISEVKLIIEFHISYFICINSSKNNCMHLTYRSE